LRHLLMFFFFIDTATTEIYTLSLHDTLPICQTDSAGTRVCWIPWSCRKSWRSEEHTSELQSRQYLVCRLLLEKRKQSSPQAIRSTTQKKTLKNIRTSNRS